MREIQKYHDGRYRSVDAVYLCGEIGNPDKERPFVPLDKVMEILDEVEHTEGLSKADEYGLLRMKIAGLKEGEQE